MTNRNSIDLSKRMHGLDILRFLLAFAVMTFHFGYYGPNTVETTPKETFLGSAAYYGQYGVLVFFLVSGFVITLSLGGRNWSEFLWARTRRLMPTMMLCATATLIVVMTFEDETLGEIGPLWLKSVSFLPMIFGGDSLDDSYWSITYEMRFYVLVALMMCLGMTRHLDILLLVLSLVGIVLAIGFGLVETAFAVLFPYAPLFALGVLLATRLRDGASPRWAIMFLLHATLALSMLYLFGQLGRGVPGLTRSALVLVCAIGVLLLAVRVRVPENWGRTATILGMISYPLYLLHQRIGYALINSLSDLGLANGWVLPIAMMTMVALACLVAVFFEHRLTKLFPRASSWRSHASVQQTA